MIHAYLFVTHNNKDHDDHGTEFHKHMFRINKQSGSNITVCSLVYNRLSFYFGILSKHIELNGILSKSTRSKSTRVQNPPDFFKYFLYLLNTLYIF